MQNRIEADILRDYDLLWKSAAAIAGMDHNDRRSNKTIAVFSEIVSNYLQSRDSSVEKMAAFFRATHGRLELVLDCPLQPGVMNPSPVKIDSNTVKAQITTDYQRLWDSAAKMSERDPSIRDDKKTISMFTLLVDRYLNLRGNTFDDMTSYFGQIGGRLKIALDAYTVQTKPAVADFLNSVSLDNANLAAFVNIAKEDNHFFAIIGANTPLLMNNHVELKKFVLKVIRENHPDKNADGSIEKLQAANALLNLIKDNKLEAYKEALVLKGIKIMPERPVDVVIESHGSSKNPADVTLNPDYYNCVKWTPEKMSELRAEMERFREQDNMDKNNPSSSSSP